MKAKQSQTIYPGRRVAFATASLLARSRSVTPPRVPSPCADPRPTRPYNTAVTIDPETQAAAPREGGVRTIEDLHGPAGRLEALLNPGRLGAEAPVAILLCHPHPLFGGTLHNKVVYHAMKTFTDLGLPVLRFNFRGAGRSEGVHDNGRGEQDDVRAGLAWLAARFAQPVVAAGFSFGAHMALRAGCVDPRVAGLISLGTPIEAGERAYTYAFLAGCAKPKLFLSGTQDAFGPVAAIQAELQPFAASSELLWVEGADHFFVGKLALMQQALRGWVQTHFLPQSVAAGHGVSA